MGAGYPGGEPAGSVHADGVVQRPQAADEEGSAESPEAPPEALVRQNSGTTWPPGAGAPHGLDQRRMVGQTRRSRRNHRTVVGTLPKARRPQITPPPS